jgi:glucosylceramidase
VQRPGDRCVGNWGTFQSDRSIKTHILIFSLFLGAAAAAGPTKLADPNTTWICSTASKAWIVQRVPELMSDSAWAPDVVIHPELPGQEIDGFGACFNELGWEQLSQLQTAERTEVMKALFSDDGCGFTLARSPIGASDYGRSWYSLDDAPGDFSLAHFTIERDRGCLIPYIKAAMAVRPELGLWASAWSPPAWMKDNGAYPGGHLKDDPQTLKSYAAYLTRYVRDYQSAGVNVYAVMVQNEPVTDAKYPSCLWSGEQERTFIRDYLGPSLRDARVPAKVWLGTINDPNVNAYAVPSLSDAKAAAFIGGVAYQYDGQDAIADTHRLYPNVRLMQSESECGNNANGFGDAEHTFALMRKYFAGGASSYFYWNMILPPGGKSSWGWAQNTLITVDGRGQRVAYHPEFYLMKHVSHFVRPGARVATVVGDWQDVLSFVRPDGRVVLVIGNSSDRDLSPVLQIATGECIRPVLPAHSFSTFVFPKT